MDPMVRVCVRRVGSLTGKLAAAPESLTALLALTTKKLKLDREEAQFCIRDSVLHPRLKFWYRIRTVVPPRRPWGSVGRSRTSRTRRPKKSVGRWGILRTVHNGGRRLGKNAKRWWGPLWG